MRTSELRSTALEAVAAGSIGLGLAMLISPTDVALQAPGPHIAWISVMLIAARYGTEGLLLALPLVWGPVVAVAGFLGAFGALGARLDRSADLAALVAAVLVGWVASTHEKRHSDLTAKVEAARQRSAAQQSLLGEFEDACLALCARADRLDVSLSFLRHVSARIEGSDLEAAAEATLELAMARLGARAGVVQLRSAGGPSRTLATSGAWSSLNGGAAELDADRAVAAAVNCGKPVRAVHLNGATANDADLVAPLRDATGACVGVLALRGVPRGGTSPAALHDLSVLGDWLSAALGGSDISRIDDGADDFSRGDIEPGHLLDESLRADPYLELAMIPPSAFAFESESAS